MRTAIAKAWHLLVAVVVALAVIVPIQLTVAPAASPALAADASRFDPGNIISDAQFYDGNAMSAGQVQSFLESRVRACDYSRAQLPCLRDYTQSTPTMGATMRCAPYQGALSERASDIIAKVGAACGISQKALLVLLQKEQSLVDDTWPWVSQYEHATGYNCPDTAPCDPAYAGFFYQVYWAAYAFQAYKANGGGPNYKAFRVNTIHWHPNAACGTSQVYIANLATAGLYNYTPYRPNAAALANLYGTGDGCSSYGNRNFWRLWSDWFGSPTASAPIGWMDSATLAKSVLTVTGWAVDPDTPATALQVQLQVNGTVVTTANAAGAKPGLGAAIEGAAPGAGDNHAYSMSTTLGVGTHIVCVVGVDTAGDTNSRLLYGGVDATDNCARIIVSSAPYGWMDSALVSSGTLTVKGWAIDPDTPTTAIEVLLVVDGDVVATRTANGKRPGLGAAVLPAAGDDHGYLFEAPIGIGTHTVCVIASNSAAGPDGNLRYGGPGASGNCAIVTHGSAAPFGWLDSAASTGSSLTVKGWAVDPDTPSAAVQVQLVVNGAIVASGSANAAKPGLGAAISTYAPGAGDNHGYSLTATLTPGTHTVCVVAENDSPGPTTTLRYGGPGAVNNCAIVVQGVVATPFGWLDSATVSGSTLTASGWAIDPSVASSPIQVELSVDGTVVARGSANRPKPGLGAAMSVDAPGAGDDHAFVLTSTLSVGTHTVCVSAIDAESGSGARLRYGGPGASNNCAAVTVSRAPFGWIDTVALSGSVVTAKGWTVDPDTASAPVEVTLVVDGVSAATATANETKPGLGAAIAADAPGSGDKHAFTLTATLSGGAHTVCVVATNTGSGPPGALRYEGQGAASNCRIVTVRTTEASPFGWMDAATISGAVVTARGWAVDPDSPSAPVQVQLVVNGNVAVTATANGSKPGLGAAIAAEAPGAGDNHAYTLSTSLPVGTHRVCVIALDDAGGTNSTLRYGGPGALNNCATVTYGINAPIGWMDSASLSGADLTVTGWSIDPDVAAAAVEVQLTVNGSVVATGAADVPKPELGEAVAADAPGAGDNHGYRLATVLSVGTHVVCVVALDNAGGPGSRLLYGGPGASDNCATVVVSKAPFGWLDSASLSLTGGVVTAKGWAIDPDVPTTPITVRLVVDGTVVATGTANGARPGLAAAVLPGAGDSHGYALEATLTPGAHTVCVVGVNNAPGPDTTLSYGGPGAVANCATVSYSP